MSIFVERNKFFSQAQLESTEKSMFVMTVALYQEMRVVNGENRQYRKISDYSCGKERTKRQRIIVISMQTIII